MIVLAHIGHWYSVFGFLVPAALVIGWIRLQARRDRRRLRFAEEWTLELRDGRWTVVAITPPPPTRRGRRQRGPRLVDSPWVAPAPKSEAPVGSDSLSARAITLTPPGSRQDGN